MIKKLLFTLFLVLSQFIAVAQNIGDYQSAGTGNWTTLSSWERWNGSSWVTPTAGEGYPGENTGTGTVLIQSGHTITIGTANLTTTLMGTVTISGTLILDGGSGTGIFTIKTPKIVITPNLSPLAKIEFTNKVTLALQANTVVEVGAGGLPTPGNGTCNNNIEISIGGIPFAYCTGGGGSTPTFADVIASGGTFAANASSNSPVCFGNAINLTGSVSGRIGTTTANGAINGANYTWTTTPSLTVANANTANATITNAAAGTYDVTLTCVTYYGSQPFSNSQIIKVTVNPLPATPTITGATTFCAGGSVTLSSSATSGNQWYNGGVLISGATSTTYSATASGTYTVKTYNGTCESSPSAGTTVTVNALPATPTISTCCSTTFCAGGSVTLTSSAASGYQWYNGGIAIPGATSITYSATTNGTYTVITSNGTCSSLPSAGTTVTVNVLPATPALSGATAATCATDGSFTITNYNAAYAYTVTPSTGVVQSGATITAPANSYTVTATDGTCTSSASSSIVIASSPTTTWDGSSWSNDVPTLSKAAIINGNYNTASNPNIEACSLTINSGATLTIQNEKFVTIQNHLTVNTGGTLEIKNQGSLVMINDAGNVTNNGTINVNKTTAEFELYDYTYWSSPLSVSTSIATTFPNWRRPYEYHPENFMDLNADGFDDNGDDWKRVSTMTRGRGYIIMGPTTGSFPRTESIVFSGAVNNGVVAVPVLLSPGATGNQAGFNLIGNPYPSAISADEFILANIYGGTGINQTLSGTLYFWTHKDNASVTNPGPEAYNYTVDDYAMYNLSGGIGTGVGTPSVSKSVKPSGYIGSGQGFFAGVAAAGTVTFNNSMRATNPSTANTQFFKTQSVKAKSKAIEKDRFWLNLQNADGMFSQQLVGYFENATMGYDNGYDGSLTDAGNFVNFYSFIDDAAYKIQGREAFNDDDQVRLGYFSSVAGTFNINIDSKEGVFNASETPIYLEDKELGIIHDLKEGAYSFETGIGNFNDRFVLRYKSTDKTLGTDESIIADNKFIVSVKERQLKVNSYEDLIDKVWVYDLLGRQIFTKEKVNSNEFVISNLVSAKQTLIVKVLLQNGQTYSNKVVY
ncbi:T9SS sorting signal type C domain-containing protein [Flavobacterium maritimum]|uniref:T9SS sorting signal type C domain-containing protein n=1 Tax=Flavobacterium maritimum TaxID=3149042 RepID=UPI0032B5BC5F